MNAFTSKVRKALERTYDAEMWIFPYEKSQLQSGETVLEEETPSSSYRCALSRNGTGRARAQTFHTIPEAIRIDYYTGIICAPEIPVAAGSRILVKQAGHEYNFLYTGESFCYATHQELQVRRLGYA